MLKLQNAAALAIKRILPMIFFWPGTLPMVLIILASFQVQNDDLDDADRTAWYVILLAGTT